MNAITERRIGGCRHELPDRALVWNQAHLRRIPREYEIHHNQHRPHRSLHGAADTAARAGRSRSVPRPKTDARQCPDQRISPGRMTWTRFSARTGTPAPGWPFSGKASRSAWTAGPSITEGQREEQGNHAVWLATPGEEPHPCELRRTSRTTPALSVPLKARHARTSRPEPRTA